MNMIKLLLAVLAIHISLVITGIAEIPGNALYTFIANPIVWNSSVFIGLFSDLFLVAGAFTIIAGTYITRSDIFIFSGVASVLLSFGLPLANLFIIVSAQANETLAILLVSPTILVYVLTCVAWWRGRA